MSAADPCQKCPMEVFCNQQPKPECFTYRELEVAVLAREITRPDWNLIIQIIDSNLLINHDSVVTNLKALRCAAHPQEEKKE